MSTFGFIPPVKIARAVAPATDNFTDTNGVLLQNHTSDSGNTWAKSVGTSDAIITNANRVAATSPDGSVYVSNWTPSSADYDVSVNLYIINNSSYNGIGGRCGSSSFTGYYALYNKTTSTLYLYRGGNATALGTASVTVNNGETHNIQLQMRDNAISVLWDGISKINVTATGADIISTVGKAGLYLQGTNNSTAGMNIDNFSASDLASPLVAGTLSPISHTSTTATLSWTNATGGTAPITAQLQRSLTGVNTWSNVGGATSSPVTDTALDVATGYDYRVAFTDATPTTLYSTTVTITTSTSCSPLSQYRCIIQTEPTLLDYWPMDESAGATNLAATYGGSAINITGATAGASGQVDGTAVSFDGINDFGATASSIDLTAYKKIVVEGLFYFNAFGNGDNMAFETGTAYGPAGSFHFDPNASAPSGKILSYLDGSTGNLNSAAYNRPSAAAWHYVAAVYDMNQSTNEISLYIDGILQTETSRPVTLNNTDYKFGNLPMYLMSRAGTSLYTQGKMQHLAIYSDLGSDRVLAHAQAAGLTAALTSGSLSETTHTNNSATLSWTGATGGTTPITTQLQRSPSGAGTWANVSGATSSPATDSGLTPSTSYDYRIAYTDATPATVYSNTVTIATVENTTYTVQVADLWDNGYDNVATPRQSTLSRLVFTTDVASITVVGTTTIYGSYPTSAHLGVRINGVNQSPLVFTANGSQSFDINLGSSGTIRTVEIIAGLQSKPSSIIGTYIDSVTYNNAASFNIQTPTIGNRVLVYGDSIAVGGNATNPESQGYVPLLRNTYNQRVMLEGWGYRSLYEDANTTTLKNNFVSRIAGYQPSIIWLAIGTNDYGLNKWSAASFGTAYAAVLDGLHTALPSARIICQTPIVRSSEGANGSGNTLPDYRAQITSACNTRAWTQLVDGTTFLTTSNLDDGVHPSTAGHAKYADRIAPYLGTPSYTTSGPSFGLPAQASAQFALTLANNATFLGDQTVTLSANNGTISAIATGGSISGNGTATVIVTPANSATGFTYTYTPTTDGTKTLTYTNGQGWVNASTSSYIADSTPPSGGSITYLNGYKTTTSVSITVSDGTDSGSDVNTSSRIVQRKSATLSSGVCGDFGDFGTITTTGTYPNLMDSNVVSGNCYQYKYLVSDNAGNQATYTSSNVVKIDTTLPTIFGIPITVTPTSLLTQAWSWTAATDTVSGIASYLWRTTGTAITNGVTDINSVTTSLAEGIYNFFIRAVDNAGNQSEESSAGTLTVLPNTYTLTYSAGSNGSIVGTSPQTVNSGANGTLVTATPASGYHFVSWSDNILTATRTDVNITADITVTATFSATTTSSSKKKSETGTTPTAAPVSNDAPATATGPISASFTPPTDNVAGSAITFDASSSTSDKKIVKYEWDFGDGATSNDIKTDHDYKSPGRYTVTLTVTDLAGNKNTTTQTVDVKPAIPTVINITAKGTSLWIEGKSDPGTTIYFTIHSNPFEGQGLADNNGYWTYNLENASDTLGEGDHTIVAEAAVKLSNNTELKSAESKTYDFKVSLDNGKLKVETQKTRTWQIVSIMSILIIILLATLLVFRRKRALRKY